MAISHERLGFFSEHLVGSMARQGVSAKALAIELGCSYEFVRKMVKSESLPSFGRVKRLCSIFRWNAKETRTLIAMDRGRRKFGRQFWIASGRNPDYEPIYILWYFLSEKERDYFSGWLRYLVAWKQRNQEDVLQSEQ